MRAVEFQQCVAVEVFEDGVEAFAPIEVGGREFDQIVLCAAFGANDCLCMAAQQLELERLDDIGFSLQKRDHAVERRRFEVETWSPVGLFPGSRHELGRSGDGLAGSILCERLQPQPFMEQTGNRGAEFLQRPEIVFP